jgi:hypothetical protein
MCEYASAFNTGHCVWYGFIFDMFAGQDINGRRIFGAVDFLQYL